MVLSLELSEILKKLWTEGKVFWNGLYGTMLEKY